MSSSAAAASAARNSNKLLGQQGEGEEASLFFRQVSMSLKHVSAEKMNAFKTNEQTLELVRAFSEGSAKSLFVSESDKGNVVLSTKPPGSGFFLFVLKVDSQTVVGECAGDYLEHAEDLAKGIYAPLVAASRSEWSDFVVREVDESLGAFVANVQIMRGHARGITSLPLPPREWWPADETNAVADDDSSRNSGSSISNNRKDAIHALEGSIVTWTKQIKAVLKLDPETSLRTDEKPYPGPRDELEFWDDKARNLNVIFDQLQSTSVRRVLTFLDKAQSTYNGPFAKLCRELVAARNEANDNVHFLSPLKSWVSQLEDPDYSFTRLGELFAPIVHLLLLIWKRSAFFNSPTRLVVFLRECCNALIARATRYLDEEHHLFELIEKGDDARYAVNVLRDTLRILAEFKNVYSKYKDKAAIEVAENPWRIQSNAVFARLDAFWERTHDILELTCTTMQFSNLAKIEVGGTKGKVLTTSITQIHGDFMSSVRAIRRYDRLLSVEAKEFEDAFYEFRVAIKELERRLASVLTQGFDDARSTNGRFKLLDSFDALVQRPSIAEELEKKYVELVVDYGKDVQQMQTLFMQHRDDPPIANNLPPIAGALTWCRGLLERVQLPMNKLKQLEKRVMESEEARLVVRDYTAFLGQLSDYERSQIAAWGTSVEASSQAKLKNSLLRFESPMASFDSEDQVSLLCVNFDPMLIRLLREVKYFLLLGFEAPSSALEIYQHSEVYRRHMGNLDLIVNMYNWIQTSMLPVERPLLRSELERINKLLAQGIGSSPQPTSPTGTGFASPIGASGGGKTNSTRTSSLNWKSSNIDLYINEAMAEVKEVTATITVMKSNLHRIEELLESCSQEPLIRRNGKAATVTDFELLQKVTLTQRYGQIRECGIAIHDLLRDSNQKLKVSTGLPDWKSYVDFINNIVISRLKSAVVVSCTKLEQQLDPAYLAKHSLGPMLEIELDLVDKDVKYIPEIGFLEAGREDPGKRGLQNFFRNLLESFIQVGTTVQRLDSSSDGYVREITEDPEVKERFAAIQGRLSDTEIKVESLRRQFKKYEYLWTTDLQTMFNDFLDTALLEPQAKKPSPADEIQYMSSTVGDDESTMVAPENEDDDDEYAPKEMLRLDLFEERIRHFLEVQANIEELKPLHEIDFLRIISQPIKQALGTWVTKWMFTFTNYLQTRLVNGLIELYDFMTRIDRGLDQKVADGDKDALMTVMTHIRDVRKRMPWIEDSLSPLREMVVLLKTHGIPLDLGTVGGDARFSDPIEFLEGATIRWDNVVNKTFRVKEVIQPLQNAMIDTIKKDVNRYAERAAKLHENFCETSNGGPLIWTADRTRDAYVEIDRAHSSLRAMEEEAEEFRNLQELFELHAVRVSHLTEMRAEIRMLKHVWDTIAIVDSLFSHWRQTLWAEIDCDDLLEQTQSLLLQVKQLPRRVRDWDCYSHLEASVVNMSTILPVVADLHSPAMRERHWNAVAATTEKYVEKGTSSFRLDDLLALDLHRHVDTISEIVETANKENKVEKKLSVIEQYWSDAQFVFTDHGELPASTEDGGSESGKQGRGTIRMVAFPEEIIEVLDEHHIQLQSMSSMGRSIDFFASQLTRWQSTLGNIELIMKMLLDVQKSWASLEAIFMISHDIRTQLPEHTKRFEVIDADFKALIANIFESPGVIQVCCEVDGREAALAAMHRELEVCQKALTEYLSIKKQIYPRFYFVSSTALLDILSNSNNPPGIVPHLGSLYEGIDELDLVRDAKPPDESVSKELVFHLASAMRAKDGEVIKFSPPLFVSEAVEVWLNKLTECMRATLANILEGTLAGAAHWDGECPRDEWVTRHPAQLALLASQIVWTEDTETALEEVENGSEDAVKKHERQLTSRLEVLIKLVQGKLERDLRTKIVTLITMDVHNRDVVDGLIAKKVESAQEFAWNSQLRYYYSEKKDVDIMICDYLTVYTYEYCGNVGRLVITPLTDRCYITLTTALRLYLGGAPAGPAGTGKTETTKDLARALGLPCYVFNCSSQMNYLSLADIFRGLSQVGAWGCFDEFNRISIEVLSVVATQVKTIQDAIVRFSVASRREPQYQQAPEGTPPTKVGRFSFFGASIELVPTVGLFITMNPGYAGRTELPENLKALFRSCAMIRPDLKPICENLLLASGFVEARPLARKFVTLYSLSSELLSKQKHYDWQLRAIKSTLLVAGRLRRGSPQLSETQVLMRALRDFNSPKIPTVDFPIFLRLLVDIFPEVEVPTQVDETLRAKIVQVASERGLQPEATFVSKVLSLSDVLAIRHSVMIIGPAGCGKTTIRETLAASLNSNLSKRVCVSESINPKALSGDELYGRMTLAREWEEGVLSSVFRSMSQNAEDRGFNEAQIHKWVCLDGPIDAEWIESLNTVMDDNKILTLMSNERIPLQKSMRMIFEVSNVNNATPATVSRAGIIYVNATDIGYMALVESWLHTRAAGELVGFRKLFEKYMPQLLKIFALQETMVHPPTVALIASILSLLDSFLDQASLVSLDLLEKALLSQAAYVLCSLCLHPETFSTAFRNVAGKAWTWGGSGNSSNVLDYYVSPTTGETELWEDMVPSYEASHDVNFSHIFIWSNGLVAANSVATRLVAKHRPFLIVGDAGTGKTKLAREFLRNYASDEGSGVSTYVSLNFYETPGSLQRQLEARIEKRSGKTFGPPSGKRLLVFIDDLNSPGLDDFGTQPPLELLRQQIDSGEVFDKSDLTLRKRVVDVSYAAAMNPRAGSFQISERLERHFTAFGLAASSTISPTVLVSYFELNRFSSQVRNFCPSVAAAVLSFHKTVRQKFLPSALKFTYQFTLKDLTAVFEGVCRAKPSTVKTSIALGRLFVHECLRVYSDRLLTPTEIIRSQSILVDVAKQHLTDSGESSDAFFVEPNHWTAFERNDDHIQQGGCNNYAPVASIDALNRLLSDQLAEYNQSNPIMNLVLFTEATEHVVRIARIIGLPHRHALLVGVGGSGKQSLARLASFILGYPVFQIAVTATYDVACWKDDLRDLLRRAGVKPALPISFILTDSQIVDEQFLVYVNDLLASCNIPDLFTRDEYDSIFASIRNAAKAVGVADEYDSLMQFFIDRVSSNLHVILCFSPIGDTFSLRSRRFPALTNATSIDVFHAWPRDALVSVAQHFLRGIENDNMAYHVAEVHASVQQVSQEYLARERRYNYVTPTSYLELISFYKTLLASRQSEMTSMITRLDTGVKTLRETNEDVTRLQESLKSKMLEVDQKKDECDEFLEKMGRQRGEAEVAQVEADRERTKADAAARDARSIEEQAAGDLALAKPALDAALKAVNCLDKASMTELKSFQKPPPGVDKVTATLLILIKREKKNFGWDNAKKMMAKVDAFKEQLESFRGEDIPPDLVQRCQPYLADPNFSYERMKTKSMAAANLCNWVVNIITFNQVYKKVKPLMDQLEMAQKAKDVAESELATVEQKLAKIDATLNDLQRSFLEATHEKAGIEKVARECEVRLKLAERLTLGLASEYARWGTEVDQLRKVEGTLFGDVALSAAFVSYVGAFGSRYREQLWQNHWIADLKNREIPFAEGVVEPVKLLTTETRIAEWMNEGLPADRMSIENGAIICNCDRWPLMIDPQLQGIKWIRAREEARLLSSSVSDDDGETVAASADSICQLQLGEKHWSNRLADCIRTGKVAIIENLSESIDAALNPLLARSVIRKGKTFFLRMGGEELEYDAGFRLYLQTRLSNPRFSPEIAATCTLVNFIVTESGLEDQLLAKVVSREQPVLEREKDDLVQAFNRYKIRLKELEDDLLFKLAEAPADILSDDALVQGLEKTKKTAGEVSEAVESAKSAEKGINEAREVYRPVAAEASQLYFMLLALNRLSPMYQYSLASFTTFFYAAMNRAPSSEPAQRVDDLQSTVRFTIYQWVTRGLFEKHRLVFLVQLSICLLQRGLVDSRDDSALAKMCSLSGFNTEGLAFLLRGTYKECCGEPPAPWISEIAWGMINALGDLDGFSKLPSDLADSAPRFLEWFNAVQPETEKLPLDWRDLDRRPFQKLLLVRCLRPDRLPAALQNMVRTLMPRGVEYSNIDTDLNSFGVLDSCFSDSTPSVPIYFLLSPGVNVVANVDRLAAREGMDSGLSYFNISLGQGQDIVARSCLEQAQKKGHWVLLNNVHLMPTWLKSIEKLLDDFDSAGDSHANFRLFFTSEPTSTIPVGVLNRSIKITSDPPSGLRSNLRLALCTFDRDEYEELEPRTRGVLFSLCHFHAIMLERRKFGPQGTNMQYPFSVGDLISSASVLRNYMENAPSKVPWNVLRYLFGEILYGGHIVNDVDRLVCSEYLLFFMRDEALDEMDMLPYPDHKSDCFHAPQTSLSHEKVLEHIETRLGVSPLAFGLHPNAEVGCHTEESAELCRSIISLSPTIAVVGEDGDGSNSINAAEDVLQDILEMYSDTSPPFDVDAMRSLCDEQPGPYSTFFLQECELMNRLIFEMVDSLKTLDLGFRGELTMSEAMEVLQAELAMDRIPASWIRVAFPSERMLASWLSELQMRIKSLSDFASSPTDLPTVTWFSGLFNPNSFLTAVLQTAAQINRFELDKLSIAVEVTKKTEPSDFSAPSRDGAYINGLSLEGARWSLTSGMLESAVPREMTAPMPVINVKASPADRVETHTYVCPCYKTRRRGPTFVTSFGLKTKAPPAKWVLAGAALLMDTA